MSISAILNSSLSPYQVGGNTNPYQKQLQQLSQDLTSGNLQAVRSEFATLQKALSQPDTTSVSNSSPAAYNHAAETFHQLATDLKSGDLAGAQQAYAALRAETPVSISDLVHQTRPPVFRPPLSTIGGLHHTDSPVLAPLISLVA